MFLVKVRDTFNSVNSGFENYDFFHPTSLSDLNGMLYLLVGSGPELVGAVDVVRVVLGVPVKQWLGGLQAHKDRKAVRITERQKYERYKKNRKIKRQKAIKTEKQKDRKAAKNT